MLTRARFAPSQSCLIASRRICSISSPPYEMLVPPLTRPPLDPAAKRRSGEHFDITKSHDDHLLYLRFANLSSETSIPRLSCKRTAMQVPSIAISERRNERRGASRCRALNNYFTGNYFAEVPRQAHKGRAPKLRVRIAQAAGGSRRDLIVVAASVGTLNGRGERIFFIGTADTMELLARASAYTRWRNNAGRS